MSGFGVASTQWSARRRLTELQRSVGAAGLAAAEAVPGIAAMVDQHAAAVRDRTLLRPDGLTAVANRVMLASYASGVLLHARTHGWCPPPPGAEHWQHADWTSLRLTAVCLLAHAADNARPALPPLQHQPPT